MKVSGFILEVTVDKRPQVELAVRVGRNGLRRPVDIPHCGWCRSSAQELGEEHDDEEQCRGWSCRSAQAVLLEAPPDELELPGGVVLVLLLGRWLARGAPTGAGLAVSAASAMLGTP
jgi:hypothetical protein